MKNINSIITFVGAEGIKNIYEECLKEERFDIICLSNDYAKVIGDFFDKIFVPKVYGYIKTREIIPDTKGNREDAESKDHMINMVRFMKASLPSESDMLLCKGRVILISYNISSPLAIVISEPEIVKSHQIQFEELWKSLEE